MLRFHTFGAKTIGKCLKTQSKSPEMKNPRSYGKAPRLWLREEKKKKKN
jgi:hypothetical protein